MKISTYRTGIMNFFVSLALVFGTFFLVGSACNLRSESKPVEPSRDEVHKLVKTTCMDFGDAIQSGDVAAFHSKVAKAWQKEMSVDKMKEAFQRYFDDRANYDFRRLLPPLKVYLDPQPKFEKVNDLDALVVDGRFETTPRPVNFHLTYIMEGKTWKLIRMNIFYSNY